MSKRFRWGLVLAAALLASAGAARGERQARTVKCSPADIVAINTKVRFTTVIVLPVGEQVLEYVVGDKDFWVVEGANNFAYVKPAREGSATNLTLIGGSGRVYSFLLQEVSGRKGEEVDLKVFVEPGDTGLVQSVKGSPKFVPAEEAKQARAALAITMQEMQRQGDILRTEQPTRLRFDYTFARGKGKGGFAIETMYHDDKFTYLHVSGRELPALYELKDGNPSLIEFQVREKVLIVPKIIDEGYLSIGKQKFEFRRQS